MLIHCFQKVFQSIIENFFLIQRRTMTAVFNNTQFCIFYSKVDEPKP